MAYVVYGDQFVDAFRQAMSIQFGSVDVLSDFGILPRKPRKALSGPEQVAKADKARATRLARHTMGKKQKRSIKGEVPQAAGANGSTATPPSVSNGSTAPG